MAGGSVRDRLARAVGQHVESLTTWGVREIAMRGAKGRLRSGVERTPPVSAETIDSTDRRARASKLAALERLAGTVASCTRCALFRERTQAVFGEGNPDAQLVFVGEAPGYEEDRQGRPFVGAAGQLLTKMIEAMGLAREDVYICNVLKSRPPGNRTPWPEEMDACRPYLIEQLAIIQPTVICALGAIAAKALLGPETTIGQVRGQMRAYEGIPVVPTFHPAYLLRNPSAKKIVWRDLKLVMKLLQESSVGGQKGETGS